MRPTGSNAVNPRQAVKPRIIAAALLALAAGLLMFYEGAKAVAASIGPAPAEVLTVIALSGLVAAVALTLAARRERQAHRPAPAER